MKVSQLKMGSLLSYLQMGLNVVISLVYTPVMISTLGASEYGLYNTVASTISMLAILNLGFSSSYIRFYSRYKSRGDADGEASLNALYLIVFSIIGLVALLCGLFLSQNLNLIFENGLKASEYALAKILVILLTINIAISFPMTVFSSIVSAHERFVFLKAVNCIKTVVSPLVMLPVLLLGLGSIGMVTVTVVLTLVADALFLWFCLKKLKTQFRFKGFQSGLLKEIFVFSGFTAAIIIGDQLNLNLGKILLGRYRGTSEVALSAVGYTLYTYVVSISNAITTVFAPRIHRLVANPTTSEATKNAQLSALFIRVSRLQFLLLALVGSGLVFFGKPFIQRWSGLENSHISYIVTLILILSVIIPLCQSIGLEIQRAKNLHRFRAYLYIVMVAINLIASIFLCQWYGAIGSAIGSALFLCVGEGIVMNIYYHKAIGINIIDFWKNILRIVKGLIIPILFGVVYTHFVTVEGYPSILLSALLYSAVYVVSIWFLSMNDYEKDLFRSLGKKILKKR